MSVEFTFANQTDAYDQFDVAYPTVLSLDVQGVVDGHVVVDPGLVIHVCLGSAILEIALPIDQLEQVVDGIRDARHEGYESFMAEYEDAYESASDDILNAYQAGFKAGETESRYQSWLQSREEAERQGFLRDLTQQLDRR